MNKPKTRQKKRTTKGEPSKKPLYPSNLTPDCLDTPAKPIEVKKPINSYNYLNALIRIPEVQKDLEALSKKPTKEKKLEIWNKYFGLEFPLAILRNLKDFNKDNKRFHRSNAIHVLSNWEKDNLNSMSKFYPSKYRDGRHVILAVDITKANGGIEEFKKVLDRIGKDYEIPKDTTRDKDTVENIWDIYDYKTKDRLNFTQIARKVSGKKGNPTYNAMLKACLERVKRAYNKAKETINMVKQDVKESIKKYEERKRG